jgi:hypothetical protein
VSRVFRNGRRAYDDMIPLAVRDATSLMRT